MKYLGIDKASFVNGEGARVVLWVSGCNHYCPGCQNPDSWNPENGKWFDAGALAKVFDAVERETIDGLTLSGGDPMYPQNREEIARICRMFRVKFGDKKTIWMYTGYYFREIEDEPIVKEGLVDVIVDGPFIREMADPEYLWAGSTNQKIWRYDRENWKWEVSK